MNFLSSGRPLALGLMGLCLAQGAGCSSDRSFPQNHEARNEALDAPAWERAEELALGTLGPSTLVAANAEQARTLLSSEDDFTRSLSVEEMRLRAGRNSAISGKEDFLAFVGNQGRSFTADELRRLRGALDRLRTEFDAKGLRLALPNEVNIVKTSGLEEGNAPYTRSHWMAIPASEPALADEVALGILLGHELFHIMSRGLSTKDLAAQDRLYGVLGFEPVGPLHLPPDGPATITNPDAPHLRHGIRIPQGDRTLVVAPFLLLRPDVSKDAPFSPSEMLYGSLFVLEPTQGSWEVARLPHGKLASLPLNHPGYLRRIGFNTDYVFHPEEALAANFELLVQSVPSQGSDRKGLATEGKPIPSKDVIERLQATLADLP